MTEETNNIREDIEDDHRYPYTHAADLLRMHAGYDKDGAKLSRLDAGLIRQLISKVIGIDDLVLAEVLATYYLDNQDELTDKAVKDFMSAKKGG